MHGSCTNLSVPIQCDIWSIDLDWPCVNHRHNRSYNGITCGYRVCEYHRDEGHGSQNDNGTRELHIDGIVSGQKLSYSSCKVCGFQGKSLRRLLIVRGYTVQRARETMPRIAWQYNYLIPPASMPYCWNIQASHFITWLA